MAEATGFMLSISTPEREFFEGEVTSVVLTTTEGEIGILASHTSMVVALVPAPIRFLTSEGWKYAALSGGFARIRGNYMLVFTDTAEWPEDIEEARAREALKRAEERLQTHQSEIEYMRSRVALERALTRLTVKKGKFI